MLPARPAVSIGNQRVCLLLIALYIASVTAYSRAEDASALFSPDGRIKVSFRLPSPDSNENPTWSASFKGKPILSDCQLGLQVADGGNVLTAARLLREHNRSLDQRIEVLFSKTDHAQDTYHEKQFRYETRQHRQLDVLFRCYNNGVALR